MIIAKTNFELNGTFYVKGDEIKTKDIEVVRKLNEKGFIEPLKYEDLVRIERELKKEE